MWPLTETQIDAIKRLDKALSMRDGSADECHCYYCPYNISGADIDDDGEIHIGGYDGKPDGFDSDCPRFVCVDRATGKWDCLCGLEVIARLLGVSVKELNEELKPYFGDGHEILGYNPTWRKAGGDE